MERIKLPYEPGYSLHEVSDIAQMNHTYLYRLVQQKKLPAYEAKDGTLKVDRDDLVAWLAMRGSK